MAASITVHLQIFKRPQLPHFSTDLDETGIKSHGLLRSFILNIVIIRIAVPFNSKEKCLGLNSYRHFSRIYLIFLSGPGKLI